MRKWYPSILMAAMVIASVVAYPQLPDQVATHWDLHGRINGYSPKGTAVFLVPVLFAGIWSLLRLLPRIDPRAENYAKFEGAYDVIVNCVLTLLAAIHMLVIAVGLGYPVDIGRVAPIGIGVVLIVIGNVLPRARPTWFVGVRTPWTLSNDRVWERTHRVAGYLMVGAGVLTLAVAFASPALAALAIVVSGITASLGSVIYSYVAWVQETSR